MVRWHGLWAVVLVAGLASAQAPEVDRKQPEAVAQAYLAAVARADLAGLRALSLRDKGLDSFLGLLAGQMGAGPEGQLFSEAGMAELALLPMPKGGAMVLGAAAPDGAGKVTYELTKTIALRPKLVMAKQADGTWLVDLAASLKASAADGKSTVLEITKMMGAVPEGALPEQQEDPQPWQCMNRLRQLSEALRTYAEEHNNKLPTAATWYDELLPYLDDEKDMVCPDHADEEFSYAFNADLGGAELPQDWEQRRHLVLLLCVKGDRANMVFRPGKMDDARGRHGKQLVFASGSGEASVLPEDWTFERAQQDEEHSRACAERMRALVTALKKYAKAHDGQLPPAEGWVEALRPLVAKPRDAGSPFICPGAKDATLISYAYNPEIAGRRLANMANLRKIVAFTEIDGGDGAPLAAPSDNGPRRHHFEWSQLRRAGFFYCVMLDGNTNSRTPPEPGAKPAAKPAEAKPAAIGQ